MFFLTLTIEIENIGENFHTLRNNFFKSSIRCRTVTKETVIIIGGKKYLPPCPGQAPEKGAPICNLRASSPYRRGEGVGAGISRLKGVRGYLSGSCGEDPRARQWHHPRGLGWEEAETGEGMWKCTGSAAGWRCGSGNEVEHARVPLGSEVYY